MERHEPRDDEEEQEAASGNRKITPEAHGHGGEEDSGHKDQSDLDEERERHADRVEANPLAEIDPPEHGPHLSGEELAELGAHPDGEGRSERHGLAHEPHEVRPVPHEERIIHGEDAERKEKADRIDAPRGAAHLGPASEEIPAEEEEDEPHREEREEAARQAARRRARRNDGVHRAQTVDPVDGWTRTTIEKSTRLGRASRSACSLRAAGGSCRSGPAPARAFRGGWLPCGRWLAARLSSDSIPRRARARLRFVRPSGTITPRREPAERSRDHPKRAVGTRAACLRVETSCSARAARASRSGRVARARGRVPRG